MGRIQRYAEGFLSLVGNKVGGREPTALSDTVVPFVDMTQLLAGRLLAVEGGISLTSNVGDQIDVQVPDNQVWLLHQVSSEVTRAAFGNEVRVSAQLTNLPGSSDPINYVDIMQPDEQLVGRNNNSLIIESAHFDTPWVLTAGVIVRFEVVDANTAALPWAGKCGFYRLTA